MHPRDVEVLAPAGSREALEAAVLAGADAVYFGLRDFNARARATNFDVAELHATMAFLHGRGVRGYVTLNTLAFDAELEGVENAIRACAAAGVDAIIVQDIGVAKLAHAIAPSLPVHASTQMTCTDGAAVELARDLGATRVILARELSLEEIANIRATTDVPVEVFVHGALCISYSGQCLTSEAIGGRSANRGACAQACRLPYDLIVDGEHVPTDERAYLLSPKDLESSTLVPELLKLGVSSLKIEGRLKDPEYVAATTRLYRAAVDGFLGRGEAPSKEDRSSALQTFTRGSSSGFFRGVNHQSLVEGRGCDHRGLLVGSFEGAESARGRTWLRISLAANVSRGDGILVEGGHAGDGEVGGRVWAIMSDDFSLDLEQADAGSFVRVWLGPEVAVDADLSRGRRIFLTNDPRLDRKLRDFVAQSDRRVVLDLQISGQLGEHFVLEARTRTGTEARVVGDAPIERAVNRPLDEATLHDKLGRLGDTPFLLGTIETRLPEGSIVPLSSLNRARRELVVALTTNGVRPHATTNTSAVELLASSKPKAAPPPNGLFVLCRTHAQAEAALDAGADGVYLDFLELTGTGETLRSLRAAGAFVGVAPPRIRKPGEEKIDRYLASLNADAVLVRGLGALHELRHTKSCAMFVGDFSLNVTNRITAAEILGRGLHAFTPSFDLDAAQLTSLLAKSEDGHEAFGPWAEVVLHHPMALFHMEHCVIAALMSKGRDYKTCGRPCERHRVSLRDRAGVSHPVEADVGCRNTVFHARPQSAVELLPRLSAAGVTRYRIELVREDAEDVRRIVRTYKRALSSPTNVSDVWRELRTDGGYGVVKGSLRVLA